MQLSAPNVRVADVETCDFSLIPSYDTAEVLRAARPGDWGRVLRSGAARGLIAELGVGRRHLTHLPGSVPDSRRKTAFDLARSAVERLMARRPAELCSLDALIFVSTSNPNPCNSQAALLAEACGFRASCMDLKAGCSGGVLGLMQAALLIQSGCRRVLVVMAENLSHLTPPEDLRMLLTVGDGAACVLLERAEGPGFLAMVHGTEPEFASAMLVRPPFPPADRDTRYAYEVTQSISTRDFLGQRWRELYQEALAAAGVRGEGLAHWFFHQTHAAQVETLLSYPDSAPPHTEKIVASHGNMGTPTFAVSMARGFTSVRPGDRYLLQAVGGGVSWCAIVAEHR